MASGLDSALRGWIEALTLAALALCDRLRPAPLLELRREEGGAWGLHRPGSDGDTALGRLIRAGEAASFEPPSARQALRGAVVRLTMPNGWLLTRALETVPLKSRPFLDAFVRHQIEKRTPWRAKDSHYAVTTAPAPGDPERLTVTVAVVPRVLIDPLAAPLAAAGARRILVEPEGGGEAIPLGEAEAVRRAAFRRRIGAAVAVAVLGLVAGLGATSWARSGREAGIAALDEAIAARRQSLAALAARRAAGEAKAGAPLPGPSVVERLDLLSAVLPDHAYLNELAFEGERLRLSGLSRDVAGLIPVIERSGAFADVAFYAPTVRMPDGTGDRFFIDMRVVGARPAPPAEGKG